MESKTLIVYNHETLKLNKNKLWRAKAHVVCQQLHSPNTKYIAEAVKLASVTRTGNNYKGKV